MEDIIAYSIIAIIALVVIFGAVLLRRRFIRSREKKLTQLKEQWDQDTEAHRKFYQQQRMQNVTPVYANLGNAAAQSTANSTPYSTPGGGTTAAQPVSNSSIDLFTGMAIGSLVNSLFSTSSHAKSSTDVSLDDSASRKSTSSSFGSSDSSSSWGDSSSSDSGPSSDW